MTADTSEPLSLAFLDAIARAAEDMHLPKTARMKQHRIRLRTIALHHGIDGVNASKKEYPEAASVHVKIDAFA